LCDYIITCEKLKKYVRWMRELVNE
jgi:hypothetical protein